MHFLLFSAAPPTTVPCSWPVRWLPLVLGWDHRTLRLRLPQDSASPLRQCSPWAALVLEASQEAASSSSAEASRCSQVAEPTDSSGSKSGQLRSVAVDQAVDGVPVACLLAGHCGL